MTKVFSKNQEKHVPNFHNFFAAGVSSPSVCRSFAASQEKDLDVIGNSTSGNDHVESSNK